MSTFVLCVGCGEPLYGFHLVNSVRKSGVEMICEMDFVRYVVQEIHAFIRILSIALSTLTTLHTPHTRLTRVIPVGTILILPPQETSIEILHDQENTINSVQTFLRKFNRISFFETPKVLLLAWDRVFKIKDALGNKQYKPEDIQELLRELFNDVQNHEELAEYINSMGWNRPAFCNNGDDDDEDYTIAVTPDFLIMDSLIMENEHLDNILETESDEFIKSSVENLVLIPNLDSTPKNDRFDTKSYFFESLLNRDESIPSGIDSDDSNSEGDTLSLERLLHDNPIPLPDTLDFSYDVRVFLPFFTYPVTSLIILSSGSEDTIFNPGIYHFSSLEPGVSHQSGTFMKFNIYPNHLNESPMEILSSTYSLMDQ
nr:hypothetical protein [Tanacetum cinerariifolium]